VQIPCKLHSCDDAHSIPYTIYQHLENENLLPYNLSWEVIFLNVVIVTLVQGCYQYSHALNDAWKKQPSYEHWVNSIYKTCLGSIPNVCPSWVPLGYHHYHWTNV
jgi:hypothetical protein